MKAPRKLSLQQWNSRPSLLRACTFLVLIAEFATLGPVPLYAATVASAPTIDLARPARQVSRFGPPAELLRAAKTQVFVPKIVPLGTKFPEPPPLPAVAAPGKFSTRPSDSEIANCGLFRERLIPLGKTTLEANLRIAVALSRFARRTRPNDLTALADWLKENPLSPWRAAILVEMARSLAPRGYFTVAERQLCESWRLSVKAASRFELELKSRVAGELASFFSNYGTPTKAMQFIRTVKTDQLVGRYRVQVSMAEAKARRAWIESPYIRKFEPVAQLQLYLHPKDELPESMRGRIGLGPYAEETFARRASRIQEVAEIAGLKLLPATRTSGFDFPVPSLVTLKQRGTVVVLKKSGSRYLVRDVRLGRERWFDERALAAEGGRTILTMVTDLPAGWSGPMQLPDGDPDTEPPVIQPLGSINVAADGMDGAVVFYDTSVTDNVSPPPNAVFSIPSGSHFGAGTSTPVTVTATDAAGNAAVPVTFDVTVGAWGGDIGDGNEGDGGGDNGGGTGGDTGGDGGGDTGGDTGGGGGDTGGDGGQDNGDQTYEFGRSDGAEMGDAGIGSLSTTDGSPSASNPDGSPSTGNPDSANQSCGCNGMPRYRTDLAECSLRISDTPLFYSPAFGPRMNFTIHYSQRQTDRVDTSVMSHVGENWTSEFFTWADTSRLSFSWIDVEPPDSGVVGVAVPTRYYAWEGEIRIYLRGGGFESYRADTDSMRDWNHPEIKGSTNIQPMFLEDPVTKNRLTILLQSNVGYPGSAASLVSKVTRTLANGTKEEFSQSVGSKLLWKKTTLPSGKSTSASYEGATGRLLAVSDAQGQQIHFVYGLAPSNEPWKNYAITEVTEPAGRSASLEYDDQGRLVAVTDMIQLRSEFGYTGVTDQVAWMKTPYSPIPTLFDLHDEATVKWVEVTDPQGEHERVEWHPDAVPGLSPTESQPPGIPLDNRLDRYNTFFWKKRAMRAMVNEDGQPGTLDYTKAHIYHWELGAQGETTRRLRSEKASMEARVWHLNEGEMQPREIAQLLEENGVWLQKYTYDDRGRMTSVEDAAGRKTNYVFTGENLTRISKANGAAQDNLLQLGGYILGSPTSVTDAAGKQIDFGYNDAGQLTSFKQKRNGVDETTTLQYFPSTAANGKASRLWKVTGPGNITLAAYDYDGAGFRISAMGSDGYAMTYEHDTFGRTLFEHYPDGTARRFLYNNLDLEWVGDRQDRWTHIEHDVAQRPVKVTDSSQRMTQYEWCPCGALEAITDARGKQTTFFYDLQGRLTEKHYEDGLAFQYQYGPNSGRMQGVGDARGQWKRYSYYPDGKLHLLNYTGGNGNSLEQARADGTKVNAAVTFDYDPVYGRLAAMTDGTGTTSYDYYPAGVVGAGRLKTVDGPLDNDTLVYAYDELGQVVTRTLGGASNAVGRQYDALGRMTQESNPLGVFGYQYVGGTNQLDSITHPDGWKAVFEYYPIVAAAGAGNGDLRLNAIRYRGAGGAAGLESEYEYAPEGNILAWALQHTGAAGRRSEFTYDEADQLSSEIKKDVPTNTELERSTWTYDPAGNRETAQVTTSEPGGGIATNLLHSAYNGVNQLTGQTGGQGLVEVEGTVDKLATVTINGQRATNVWRRGDGLYGFRGTAQFQSGANTLTVTATDANSHSATATKPVTIVGAAIASLTYDAAGNLIHDGARQYIWDAESRVVEIDYNDGSGKTEFTYDGVDRRVSIVERDGSGAITSNTRCVWEGLSIAEDRDGTTGEVRVRYFGQGEFHPGNPLATQRLLYRSDHLGSVRELTDTAGTSLRSYDYDLWGRRSSTIAAPEVATLVAYTGHRHHERSGLALAPYRAYSADLGRWLSRDPIEEEGGLNLYAYVENSPINWLDPLGLDPVHLHTTPAFGIHGINHMYLRDPKTGKIADQHGSSGFARQDDLKNYTPNKDPKTVLETPTGMTGEEFVNAIQKEIDRSSHPYPWAPGLNDCHNAMERAFKNLGVGFPQPPAGRFGH